MLGQEGYKVKSAHFADNARTVVDVTWEHDTEKDVREYISATLDQDGKEVVGDKAWENLLTHIDIQSIHVNTGNYILNQKKAFDLCDEVENLILAGSAGTGKTFIALYLALEAALERSTAYDKVIIMRSVVSVREVQCNKRFTCAS